jgi:hypothetical protein
MIIRRLGSFVVRSALLVLAYWLACVVTREADGVPAACRYPRWEQLRLLTWV